MKRLVALDVLRGILLLMMVVDHSPSQLRRLTDQPFGFFSTAEAFVSVSALLAGMLFRRRVDQHGFAAARVSTLRRAWRIYRAHLLTLGFAFLVGSLFLTELPGDRNLLDHFLQNPWAAGAASTVLLFRPPLMDILPLYIVFSVLTPVAFWAAGRWGWQRVLAASLSLWLLSQTHLRDALVAATKTLSYVEPGPFDLLAWQLLWIAGLWLGQRASAEARASALPGALRLGFIALAVGFLGWRWWSTYTGVTWPSHTWWLDKWHLGPLRLLNFTATAWLISNFLNRLERWQGLLRPLSLIGRHMLPIFCFQICLSVLLIGVVESPTGAAEPLASILVSCQLITAVLLGWFFEWRSDRQRITAAAGPRGTPLMTGHSCLQGRPAEVFGEPAPAWTKRPGPVAARFLEPL
jgi:hypothetical protein